ncbi:hypothetical protein DOM21_18265 [Bacteriovorax stolpii]|uniref:hypothetical protein n=1 Tax=Bacteriovorax stolpii TaxID=960 RepID=UPI001158F6FB|nr:hypothetical protein [Bacteriovorax stolpii]QDK43359.1 hypothetical protein DOM21_18265 [Bacteriovorax stolpii]
MFIIRFIFYFTLSFAIMCIPIGGGRQVFDKLYSMVTPYARDAAKATKQKFSSTKRYSKKLYSNSEPSLEEDQVKSKMAAVKKKKSIIKENGPADDTYSDEEQERLRRALSDE